MMWSVVVLLGIALVLMAVIVTGAVLLCLYLARRSPSQADAGHPTTERKYGESPRPARFCPTCGSAVPADAPQGLCPRCLLRVAIAPSYPENASPPTAAYGPGQAPLGSQELAPHFPQLEIVELLGAGGMGAVYKARQPHLDRFVALKVLPPESAKEPAFAERFAREARALARLNHPHIVGVHDFGQSGGLYFLMMEYVDGVNLRQALRAGQLTSEEALGIVPQLCDALQFAHDEGVVHRDIKPENILLDRRGRVKVADFGLAKILGQSVGDLSLTGTRQVMGTMHYMAPEQLAGAKTVDHRADIYSLGVTFYEMLTGELPLGHFPPPSQTAGIDARLDPVVMRTLEREPADRYQHASDVKTEVETIVREPARGAKPEQTGLPERGTARQPRYATWVGIPTLVLIVLVVLIGFGFVLISADSGAAIDTLVSGIAYGSFVLVAAMFGVLNLLWRYRRRWLRVTGIMLWPRPMGIMVWTLLCIGVYLDLWMPHHGILDRRVWPYGGTAESTVVLQPRDPADGSPAWYRRLVITETIETRRAGWAQALLSPGTMPATPERTRHEFVVQLDCNDGRSRELFIDALDGMSWRDYGFMVRGGWFPARHVAFDRAAALGWMRNETTAIMEEKIASRVEGKEKDDEAKVKDKELQQQTRFWASLIQEAATRETIAPQGAGKLQGRQAVGRLARLVSAMRDEWMRDRDDPGIAEKDVRDFPFQDDWMGTEKASFGPDVSILWVGVPVMLAVWLMGLRYFRRRRAT